MPRYQSLDSRERGKRRLARGLVNFIHRAPPHWSPEFIEARRQSVSVPHDYTQDLAGTQAPVLLIHGRYDRMVAFEGRHRDPQSHCRRAPRAAQQLRALAALREAGRVGRAGPRVPAGLLTEGSLPHLACEERAGVRSEPLKQKVRVVARQRNLFGFRFPKYCDLTPYLLTIDMPDQAVILIVLLVTAPDILTNAQRVLSNWRPSWVSHCKTPNKGQEYDIVSRFKILLKLPLWNIINIIIIANVTHLKDDFVSSIKCFGEIKRIDPRSL
jgi:hypothetical protein